MNRIIQHTALQGRGRRRVRVPLRVTRSGRDTRRPVSWRQHMKAHPSRLPCGVALLALALLPSARAVAQSKDRGVPKPSDLRLVGSEMIWDAAPHNAFTDLYRWKDRWYCSFR